MRASLLAVVTAWSLAALAPGAASNPVPPDGQVDVPLMVTLDWASSPGAATYGVFLWEKPAGGM